MELTTGYVAGLFDGEGSISIVAYRKVRKSGNVTRGHVLTVAISNTHRGILEQIRTQFGGAIHSYGPSVGQIHGKKRVSKWVGQSLIGSRFLRTVRSELVIKAAEADVALEFQALIDQRYALFGHRRWAGSARWHPGPQLPEVEFQQREALRQRLRSVRVAGP